MPIDYTRLLQKLAPQPGGEDALRFRTGVVDAINSNGTANVTVSGIIIPNVPVMAGAGISVGATVWLHAWRGGIHVVGVQATDADQVNRRVAAGTYSGTTDANGRLVITHGAGFTPTIVACHPHTPEGGTTIVMPAANVTTITATTFTARHWDRQGNVWNALAVQGHFIVMG